MSDQAAAPSAPWMLSSDCHIVEPPDLFTSRVPSKFAADTPRVVTDEGLERWIFGDRLGPTTFGPGRAGDRFMSEANRPRRFAPSTWAGSTFAADVPLSAYDPAAWLAANETDGVYGGVVFPSHGLICYSMIEASDCLDACCTAMNEWLLEFAQEDPKRIKPLMMLNVDDVSTAVSEMARLRNAGGAGLIVPVRAPVAYDSPIYEPLWAAAEDLDMPINFHVVTTRDPGREDVPTTPAMVVNNHDYKVRCTLTEMIFSGVFERHPRLQVIAVENEGGWAPFFMDRMDWHYQYNARIIDGYHRFAGGELPSDYMRRNVYISFAEDAVLMQHRTSLGLDKLMWGNDFPHAEGTFPRSEEFLERDLPGVSASERILLTQTNCAKMYDFDMTAAPSRPAQ